MLKNKITILIFIFLLINACGKRGELIRPAKFNKSTIIDKFTV